MKISKDILLLGFLIIGIIVLGSIGLGIAKQNKPKALVDKVIEKEVYVEPEFDYHSIVNRVERLEIALDQIVRENNHLADMLIFFLEETKDDLNKEPLRDIVEEDKGKTFTWPPTFKFKLSSPSSGK